MDKYNLTILAATLKLEKKETEVTRYEEEKKQQKP